MPVPFLIWISLWLDYDPWPPPPQAQPAIHPQPLEAKDCRFPWQCSWAAWDLPCSHWPAGMHTPSMFQCWVPHVQLSWHGQFQDLQRRAATVHWFRCALRLTERHVHTFQELSPCSGSAAISGWIWQFLQLSEPLTSE